MTMISSVFKLRFLNAVGAALGLLGLAAGEARADAMYSVTDVGASLGTADTFGTTLNNQGQVLFATGGGGSNTSYLYGGGQLTSLGASASPTALNNNGQVASYPYVAINDSGQLLSQGPNSQAFLTQGSTTTLLGNNLNVSQGALNNAGQVTGSTPTAAGGTQPFLYSGGQVQSLGLLPGLQEQGGGVAINSKGDVVGWSLGGGIQHGFVYSNGQMTDLGTLGGNFSTALGINDAGQVVGGASDASGQNRAFLYEMGHLLDLNQLIAPINGVSLIDAQAINASGQILALGLTSGGDYRAFLLSPVPEPTTLALAAFVGAGILARRIRGKKPAGPSPTA